MKAVLLAGGGGTRLWPLSRSSSPKQLKAFVGRQTLLQKTFTRIKKIVSQRNIMIAANVRDVQTICRQLPSFPKKQLSLEPVKRDTAAAIGLAALRIAHTNPKEIIFMVNADHVIMDEQAYIKTIRLAEDVVRQHPDYSVLVGLEPTYPETGYGYIKLKKLHRKIGKKKIFYAERFIEKPTIAKAKKYIKRWNYLWNPAMFVWRVDHLLSLYKKHLPRHYRILMKIKKSIGTKKEDATVKKLFSQMPPISIDFGIMEKLTKMLVIPASLGWADIGHWRTVQEMLESGYDGNTVRGHHVGLDTSDSLIFNMTDQLVATAGVKNVIVINTDDAVLVCDREHAQDVKKIVEMIKKRKWLKYL
ncbi:mannose-1-phosphate guanylyltransferase [Patescibacteria group bacterium]